MLEATSIGLDQGRLDGLPIRAVAWTSFSADHLDYHGSRLRYFRSKRRLLQRAGVAEAVLWTGRRPLAALAQRLRADGAMRVWSLREGRGKAERSGAERSETDALVQSHSRAGAGWTARLRLPDGAGEKPLDFGVASRARHDLHNMAVALLLVRAMGGDLRAAAKLSPQLLAPPGRMQEVRLEGGDAGLPRVWIDYSHTPAALESALSSLRDDGAPVVPGGLRRAARRRQAPAHGRSGGQAGGPAVDHRRQPQGRGPRGHPCPDCGGRAPREPAPGCASAATGARPFTPPSPRRPPGPAS